MPREGSTPGPATIVFICSANVCRSPMAHAILAAEIERRRLPATVLSAGLWAYEEGAVALNVRLICEKHGTPVPKVQSTHVDDVDLAGATRVFAMERSHVSVLRAETRCHLREST
jgi:protein-tyrosine-phosphatase